MNGICWYPKYVLGDLMVGYVCIGGLMVGYVWGFDGGLNMYRGLMVGYVCAGGLMVCYACMGS